MDNNEQRRAVNPRLNFCFKKFGASIKPSLMASFLSDPSVEKEMLSAMDNGMTIDEWFVRSIAESLYEARYVDGLKGATVMGRVFRKTSIHLGVYNEAEEIEHKQHLKELKHERRLNQSQQLLQ